MGSSGSPPVALRQWAPALLLIAGALGLFRDTAAAMVGIWLRSETFAHAFLVPPIVTWLVWRKRAALASLQPRAQPWVVLPAACVCLLWLLGEMAGARAVTQFALVALLVLSVPAVFGFAVARALAFALAFAFFAVPVGEFMVPVMIDWTADFTVAALRLSGVPVFREGAQFVIPSGSWSVVEACSGVRYLIASFMVGTLFAYLNFQSLRRRLAFITVSLLLPVLANWVRAYLIVMLGHLSGNRLAVGVDHILYGWIFFGVVVGLMFMVGARWAEPAPPPLPTPASAGAAPARASWSVGAAIVLLMAGTQAAYRFGLDVDENAVPELAFPAAPAGWVAESEPLSDWQPAFRNARRVGVAAYSAGPARVGVWVGYYRNQGDDRKLVTSGNRMTEGEAGSGWAQVTAGTTALPPDGVHEFRTAELRGSALPGAPAAERLRVWQVYWIGGRFITGDIEATVQLALDRLRGRGDDAAVLLLYTPLEPDRAGAAAAADATLGRFVAVQFNPLAAALEAVRRQRAAPARPPSDPLSAGTSS